MGNGADSKLPESRKGGSSFAEAMEGRLVQSDAGEAGVDHKILDLTHYLGLSYSALAPVPFGRFKASAVAEPRAGRGVMKRLPAGRGGR